MAIVTVDGVSKAFRIPVVRRETIREHVLDLFRPQRHERLQVLDAVSFEVEAGETLGVMGRNGAGKSTLLKIVCGVYPPDRGSVRVRGTVTPILELGVGWQTELDAVDNVLLIGTVLGLTIREIRQSMDEILGFAELERFANLKLKHYSSGMAARLAYAVAFRAVREVLVLDEIFAVGDAGFKARCERRFSELRERGHTVILVSHDPRVIATFCDRALLLDGARVKAIGRAADIADEYLVDLRGRGETAPHTVIV